MRLFGYELTFRVRVRLRPAPTPLPQRLVVQMVRVKCADYSVPAGTIGVVETSAEDGLTHFVAWATGGSSGPIADADLERLGLLSLPLRAE